MFDLNQKKKIEVLSIIFCCVINNKKLNMEFHFGDLYIENEHEVSLENYHCKVKHFCITATGTIETFMKCTWPLISAKWIMNEAIARDPKLLRSYLLYVSYQET